MRPGDHLPRRIVVIGTSGSGKTTLARKLAAVLDIEPIHRDAYNHPDDEPNGFPVGQREGVLDALYSSSDGWVLDGAPYWYEEEVYPLADTIIALDYSKPLVLWRCIRRAIRDRDVKQLLARNYALRWAWKVHGQRHREISELSSRFFGRVIVHDSPSKTQEWLRGLIERDQSA